MCVGYRGGTEGEYNCDLKATYRWRKASRRVKARPPPFYCVELRTEDTSSADGKFRATVPGTSPLGKDSITGYTIIQAETWLRLKNLPKAFPTEASESTSS